jgi:hypothetical protein
MSKGLWERRFGRDPEILSKTILLNGESHVVIGILGDSPGLRDAIRCKTGSRSAGASP